MDPALDVPGGRVERALVGDEPGGVDELQGSEELEEKRHADGRDERRDTRCIAQRLVRHPLDRYGEQGTDHHREKNDRERSDDDRNARRAAGEKHLRPLVEVELAHRIEAGERAHHEHVAMGEVDQLHDAVDHRVSQGDEGVDASELQPVQDVLKELDGILCQVADEDPCGRDGDDDEEPVSHPRQGRAPAAGDPAHDYREDAFLGHVLSARSIRFKVGSKQSAQKGGQPWLPSRFKVLE